MTYFANGEAIVAQDFVPVDVGVGLLHKVGVWILKF